MEKQGNTIIYKRTEFVVARSEHETDREKKNLKKIGSKRSPEIRGRTSVESLSPDLGLHWVMSTRVRLVNKLFLQKQRINV